MRLIFFTCNFGSCEGNSALDITAGGDGLWHTRRTSDIQCTVQDSPR